MASNVSKLQIDDWFEWAWGYGKVTALNEDGSYQFDLHKYNGEWTKETEVRFTLEENRGQLAPIFRKYSWSIEPQYIRPIDRRQAEATLSSLYQQKVDERRWITLHSGRTTSGEEAALLNQPLNPDVISIIRQY